MALRYWVGGTANWDATAGTKWSLTSGGAGGQAVPTSADDVIFDAASGAIVCTMNVATTNAKTIDCTNFTGTLAFSINQLVVAGNITWGSGMTTTASGGSIVMSAAGNYTSNGHVLMATFFPSTGAKTYVDACTFGSDFRPSVTHTATVNSTLTVNGNVTLLTVTFTCNGGTFDIKGGLDCSASVLTGTSLVTMTGTGTCKTGDTGTISSNLTFNTAGTITISGTGGSNLFTYRSNTLTFNAGTFIWSPGVILVFQIGSPVWTVNTNIGTTPTFSIGNANNITGLTINGTTGFNMTSFSATSSTANSYISFKFGNTYTTGGIIMPANNQFPSAAARAIIKSGTPGSKVSLTLNHTGTCDFAYADFIDIDNSIGKTIWVYKGTATNCNNVKVLPLDYTTITN